MTNFPDRPTYEMKVRTSFEDFDLKKTRAITLDAFAQSFARLALDMPPSTVQQLFGSIDANRDEHITYPEWQRFAEMYPTLLDCIYYRAKDYWSNVIQKENIHKAADAVQLLRQTETERVAAHSAAQSVTDAAEQALEAQRQLLRDAENQEVLALSATELARRDVEAARAELLQRQAELTTAKDTERLANTAASEAQHAAEAAARRVAARESQLTLSEARLREIERLLVEQRAVVDEHRAEVDKSRSEMNSCDSRAREAAMIQAEASRALHVAADSLARAEEDVQVRQAAEKDAQARHRQAQLQVMAEESATADKLKHLAAAREAEELKRLEVDDVRRAVQNGERDLLQLETEERAFVKQRLTVNDEERPLIDREVSLRAERQRLESSEARLVHDFVAYTGRSGEASVPPLQIANIQPQQRIGTGLPPSPGRGLTHTPRLAGRVTASPARP